MMIVLTNYIKERLYNNEEWAVLNIIKKEGFYNSQNKILSKKNDKVVI